MRLRPNRGFSGLSALWRDPRYRRSAFGIRRSAFGVRRSAFSVRRSAFGVRRSAFSVWRSSGAVRTSVTLMGQDIGNTVTF